AEQFSANVLPGNADNKVVNWTSSNTSVATVNATTGLVTAVSSGTTNIIATATDGSDVTGYAALEVTIANQKPTAWASANFTSGAPGLTVEFTGDTSDDPDFGDTDTLSYLWDFGEPGATSTLANDTYQYVAPGTFTVTLTVTDSSGAKDSKTIIITIYPNELTWDLSTGTLSGPANTDVYVEISMIGSGDGNATISTGSEGSVIVCNSTDTDCPYPIIDSFVVSLGEIGTRTFRGNHFGTGSSVVTFRSNVGEITVLMSNNGIPR
ncbi:PKD domain-containing protein, partial [Zobellia nedashkovskayae]